jgi:hypothetical protein
MKKFGLLLLLTLLVFDFTYSQTPQTLPFSQNWSNTGLITTNDVWSGVPGIIGNRGDDITTSVGADPQTLLEADDPGVSDVNANQTDPNTFSTGGVTEFHITDPVVALSGSGTADAPYIRISIITTGKQSIHVSYNVRDIDGSVDNTAQQLALQYRIGNSGNFTNIPAGYIADASTGPNLATLVTPISVTLPSNADNQSEVQIRIITSNAVGNDEWLGIDDIYITGTDIVGSTSPVIGSPIASSINVNSAQLNAEVTSDGGATVTARGFVYSETATNSDPLIVGTGVTNVASGSGTGSFNESISGLFEFTQYTFKGYATNSEGTSYTNAVNFTTLKDEPTNHVTLFSSASGTPDYSAINLSWTDANGGTVPDGYLIKASTTSYAAIVDPVDGTPESDGLLIKNITQGTEIATFSGLNANTTYYFKIFPYTNPGSNINYKIDGTIPQDDITTDPLPALPNAWINEFHYDNLSTDVNEFVEVIVPNSLTTPAELAKFSVVLYNGNGGSSYDTRDLGTYTLGDVDAVNGFTYYSLAYPVDGIQNGAPDGLALGYDGSLIMFLSYEGTFTGVGGIASGILSTDVGVFEDASINGTSIGLSGTGTSYNSFTWELLTTQTPGSANTNQALPVELSSFSASVVGNAVRLNWKTETEVNNYGFEIERYALSAERQIWNKVGFVNGNGNSNSPKSYSFVDDKVNAGKYSYRLKQIDNDGQFEYSKAIEVDFGAPKKFELSQNYPNPFNPVTTIRFNLPEAGNVKLTLFNILGQELKTLVNEFKESGVHTINFDASELNSGMYIYKIEAGTFVQTRKMTLVK